MALATFFRIADRIFFWHSYGPAKAPTRFHFSCRGQKRRAVAPWRIKCNRLALMSEASTTPPLAPKFRLPIWLLAAGIVGFLIFAFSFGGLVFWLVTRRPGPATGSVAAPAQSGTPGAPIDALLAAAPVEELFNGVDLEGWDYDPAVWSVRNGVIYGNQKRAGAGSALFWRDSDIGDFELRFQFRLVRGNSGINYRSTRLPNFDVGGYEFEIYTNKTGNLANVGNDRERHRLYRAGPDAEPTDANWHEGIIIANGLRLVHVLDGKTLCDVEDTDPAALRTGVIAFGISTGTTVEFKDLRLKRLKSNP